MPSWMVVVLFVVFFPLMLATPGLANLLFFREKDEDQKFVTRAELRTAIDGVRLDIKTQLQEMNDYIHKTAHDHNDVFHTINLRLERLLAMEDAAADKKPK